MKKMNVIKIAGLAIVAALLCTVLVLYLLTDSPEKVDDSGVIYYGTVTDRAMSVVKEGDRKGRAYITVSCDDGTDRQFWIAKDCADLPEELLGKYVMVLSREEEGTGLTVTSGVVVMDKDWGVTLTAENVTSSGLTIVCTQSGGDPTGELITGSYYCLERYRDGGWVRLDPIPEDLAWDALAWMIPMNGTVKWDVDWSFAYGTLSSGRYRIGKEIMDFRETGDHGTAMHYAQFAIE